MSSQKERTGGRNKSTQSKKLTFSAPPNVSKVNLY